MRWLVRKSAGGWGIAGLGVGESFLLDGRMLAVNLVGSNEKGGIEVEVVVQSRCVIE